MSGDGGMCGQPGCGLPVVFQPNAYGGRWVHDVPGMFVRGCRAALFHIDRDKWLVSAAAMAGKYARPSRRT